jgi:transposase-like protein
MTVSTKRKLKRQIVRRALQQPTPELPGESEPRRRPGKRSVEEKRQAVLELLAGKATVEQVAQRLAVLPETVEGWRQDALAAMAEALRQPSSIAPVDRELERENTQLKRVVTKLVMQKELLENALDMERDKRPTRPGRSSR